MTRPAQPAGPIVALPFGVVMATGGAGEVARLHGLPVIGGVLTGVAVGEIVVIVVSGVLERRWGSLVRWRFGLFTVPLGLAVVGSGLAVASTAAAAVFAVAAWATTLAFCARVPAMARPHGRWGIRRWGIRRWGIRRWDVDGTWFLAPAALLGDASLTAQLSSHGGAWIRWVAVVACLLGVGGYLLVLALSLLWIRSRGLADGGRSPWWISAGCGGLAAAALGVVAKSVPEAALRTALDGLLAAMWIIATVLLAVVFAACFQHVCRRGRAPVAHLWTPVFSSAVYAAGSDQFAARAGVDVLSDLAAAMAALTLALWLVNCVLHCRELAADNLRSPRAR